ncbi:DNA alkylation repair protein [Flavobacterium akiainvivens]|uniref:DNA alkylation repair protein n=1 Tax=Flavobacterium akiainvivens TaxID=1202724 RepID=A0A0M8MDY9_9FLAO|nr:DNA alkylation repair protein [Flavobacterium akiainvivens]
MIHKVRPSFSPQDFISQVMNSDFEQMEWKERVKHTTKVLHRFMPANYSDAVVVLRKIVAEYQHQAINGGLEHVIFPDYIETYGLDYFETSVKAFDRITRFISCEFAVRPFIIRYGDAMIAEMLKFSQDPHPQVRRLASEGSRSRLPWAMAIPALKKDPTPLLPILENLKNDPSEMVRRSVANNLNDISKDNPQLLVHVAQEWTGHSKETDAIVKHACRTLFKQGHPEIMALYGLDVNGLILLNFQIHTTMVYMGNEMLFSFSLRNSVKTRKKVRLEYAIYFQKANRTLAKKVFKISEKMLEENQQTDISKKHSFRFITTRKYYAGLHQIAIIINGIEHDRLDFTLQT